MDATLRNATTNQATIDYEIKSLIIKNKKTTRADYKNITGGDESLPIGTLLGKVQTAGANQGYLVPCKSGATDGSQVPVGILLDVITEAGTGTTVTGVLYAIGGDANTANIVFDGTDTLATFVTNTGGVIKSIKDWLLAETLIVPITVEDSSYFDN